MLEVPMWVMGKTRQSALQAWFELVLLVPLVVLAVHQYGIVGAAMSRALVSILMLPLMLYLTSRVCPVGFWQLASTLWRPLLAAILMALVLSVPFSYPAPRLLALVSKVGVGAIVYTCVLLLLWVCSGRPESVEATILRQIGLAKRRSVSSIS
jgi:O-antigen/teichoic acid export membrane protein